MSISKGGFSPRGVTVKAGGSVTWTNKDTIPHAILLAPSFSEALYTDDTYSMTFNDAGTHKYSCRLHPSEIGAVVVP